MGLNFRRICSHRYNWEIQILMELIQSLIYLNLEAGDRKVITFLWAEAADLSSAEVVSLNSSLRIVLGFKVAEIMTGSLMVVSIVFPLVEDLKLTSLQKETNRGTGQFIKVTTITQ